MNARLLFRILVIGLVLALFASGSTFRAEADAPPNSEDMVSPASQTLSVPLTDIKTIDAGGFHACAVTEGGGVKCWGSNVFGELGNGSTETSDMPVDVSELTSGVKAVAAGEDHTCAVTAGGGVKCWGSNGSGELGDNSTTESHTPVDVVDLGGVITAITAGYEHTCALTTQGGVKCWGDNQYGQLGDNSTKERHKPVNVYGLASGVVAIDAGDIHTCALTEGGGVKCWGDNEYGQLGNNSTTDSDTPVIVTDLTNVKAIGSGDYHTCAVTDDGAAHCWGEDYYGQLGDGSPGGWDLVPDKVVGLDSGVEAIGGGEYHTCALIENGGVKCWGRNENGQLGDNSFTERHSPADVSGLSGWLDAVSVGAYYTCALTALGGVKCWGWNLLGQLGDGTRISRSIPGDVVTEQTCYELWPWHTGNGSDPVAAPERTPGCPARHFLQGESIALFADPDAGLRVNGWSGTSDDTLLGNVNSLTMPAHDVEAGVVYARCRALTSTHTGSGGDPVPATSSSLNCPAATYVAGETIALIAKPNADQRVKAWSGTDTNPGVGMLVNTLTMPASTRTVKATYEACYLLTAQVDGNGDPLTALPAASTGCAAGRYVAGQSVMLSVAPASGWTVDGWSGTSDDASTAVSNNVVMPSGDHIVGVTYVQSDETDSLYLPVLRR